MKRCCHHCVLGSRNGVSEHLVPHRPYPDTTEVQLRLWTSSRTDIFPTPQSGYDNIKSRDAHTNTGKESICCPLGIG
jgi:hypothetical protein